MDIIDTQGQMSSKQKKEHNLFWARHDLIRKAEGEGTHLHVGKGRMVSNISVPSCEYPKYVDKNKHLQLVASIHCPSLVHANEPKL